MTFGLVLLATFLMWTMWICAFLHQMNPMARPTVLKPAYNVRCGRPEICRNFPKEQCDKVFGLKWYETPNEFGNCYCITDTTDKNYDPKC